MTDLDTASSATLPSAPAPTGVTPGGLSTFHDPIRPPSAAEQRIINAAEAQRRSALESALALVNGLLDRQPDDTAGAPSYTPEDSAVADKVARWLYVQQFSPTFWDVLPRFRDLIEQHQALGTLNHWVDEVKRDHAYVYAYDPTLGVYFTVNTFFVDNATCQREVITHEYFHHVVGPDHYYTTQQTEEALKCPHHLAELVFDLATGCTLGCSTVLGICH